MILITSATNNGQKPLKEEHKMQNLSSLKKPFGSFIQNLKLSHQSLQNSLKKPASRKALTVSAFVMAMQFSQRALAFANVFTGKGKSFIDNVVLIGYYGVGIALVLAVVSMLSNRGPNWRWIGTIGFVGVALTGFDTLWDFFAKK